MRRVLELETCLAAGDLDKERDNGTCEIWTSVKGGGEGSRGEVDSGFEGGPILGRAKQASNGVGDWEEPRAARESEDRKIEFERGSRVVGDASRARGRELQYSEKVKAVL